MERKLASYRRTVKRIREKWSAFSEKRSERLKQQDRYGVAAERVAENILEDLFTVVLDWRLSDINHQVGYTDLLLTRLGIKYIIFETKRPGALAWNRWAVETALDQACRYAAEQKVKCVGVSDGIMLYAADVSHGGLQDRVFVSLDSTEPQETLWWLSVHGIYRKREDREDAVLRLLPELEESIKGADTCLDEALVHPRYKLPARCFAYVPDASNPKSWKLPYRLSDGSIDTKRLPKAIQAILTNYRGVKVSEIDEKDIPDILVTLAHAAVAKGKMPHQVGKTASTYFQLAEVLEQLGRLEEVINA